MTALLVAVALMTPLGASGEPDAKATSPHERSEETVKGKVSISSDRLFVDTESGTAHFKGDVIVRHNNMVLKCEELHAEYDPEGKPGSMIATGSVRLSRGEVFARARKAVFTSQRDKEGERNRVILSGAPRLWRGAHQLKGPKIEIDLQSGKIEVIAPRGEWSWVDSKQP